MNPMSLLACLLSVSLAQSAPKGAQPIATPAQQAPAQSAPSLAAERRELAEIRLSLGVERDFKGAKERLVKLDVTLAARSDADAKELRDAVELLLQDVRHRLGEAAPAKTNGSEDAVDQAVADALARGDIAFVRQLGRRAAPALVSAIRRDLNSLPSDYDKDPLILLVGLDPLAASKLVGELSDESGFFWRKRIGRLLESGVTDVPALWSSGSPQQWLGEGLSSTAEKYAEDPDIGLDALGFLLDLAKRRSESFDAIVERALRSPDPERRAAAQGAVHDRPELYGQARLEALLEDPDPELRALAAVTLANSFPETTHVLALARDPAPQVRLAVLHQVAFANQAARWTAEQESAFFAFLQDDDEAVASSAWKELEQLTTVSRTLTVPPEQLFREEDAIKRYDPTLRNPPSDESLRALAAAELTPGRRAVLARVASRLPAPLCFDVLEALARDAHGPVLAAVAERVTCTQHLEDPSGALRVVGALLDNAAFADREDLIQFTGSMTHTRPSMEAMLRFVLARHDESLLQAVLPETGDYGWIARVVTLEPAVVVEFIARVHVLPGDLAANICSGKWGGSPALSAAFRELARDERRPLGLRALALHAAVVRGDADDDFMTIARSVLSASGWREQRRESSTEIVAVLGRLPGTRANELILRIVRDDSYPQELSVSVVPEMREDAEGAPEIVKHVVERGFGSEPWQTAVREVLEAMGRVPALQDPEVLTRAARDPLFSDKALWAIGNLRDPRYLPLLSDIVAHPRNSGQRDKAVEALFGYLDAGAVEPLLAAAALVTDAGLRDKCLAQLEKIREYQDAKERWATRKVQAQTREQVLAQLVEQLGAKSDDVKVQAIRALATWEAVEVMPRLIELTSSGSKSVAAAAREALDRLNERHKD